MNLHNSPICEDQHQALNSYLESLLCLPQEMSTSSQVIEMPQSTPAVFSLPADVPVEPIAQISGTRLKCFVFTVAGLKLALPLARVTEIVEFSECRGAPVAPLVLGQLAYDGQQVPVLDSARIILPDSNVTPSYRWLVIVDHGSYALACDAVDPGLEVAHDTVRWRTQLTRRRWLAGTLLQHRCAILDADEVYEQSADNIK